MNNLDVSTKMVVGLGNPGAKYTGTRHNVGFEVLDRLSQLQNAPSPRAKFEGQFSTTTVDGRKLVLVWPMTFMNHSGRCVRGTADFFKIDVESDLLVICDDLSLPTGKLRLRAKGSAGGQKGLSDILNALGTQQIPRLRVGIDQAPPRWDTADYVLGKFRKDEQQLIEEAVNSAASAALDWCKHDILSCMNRVN